MRRTPSFTVQDSDNILPTFSAEPDDPTEGSGFVVPVRLSRSFTETSVGTVQLQVVATKVAVTDTSNLPTPNLTETLTFAAATAHDHSDRRPSATSPASTPTTRCWTPTPARCM